MNYGFVKRSDWVYEDRNFEQPITLGGAVINARSLTTDRIPVLEKVLELII